MTLVEVQERAIDKLVNRKIIYKSHGGPSLSWIDCLLEATSEAETPTNYIYWAGISIISAVIGPHVYINRGGVYKLSPNTFIMLIGESGLGKGLPISVAKKLVRLVDSTRVIAGRNTIQAIIRDLSQSETSEKNGVPKFKDSRGYIVSGEFATLLQEDKSALPVLTEFYDTHFMSEWINTTKSAGVDKLTGINITLFGGSTPEHFNDVVPDADVKGGFVGRILTVFAEERSKINPLSDTEMTSEFPYEELANHLKLISQVKGAFKYTKDGKRLWEEWYTDIRTRKVHDPTGAVNRLPDNVLKVAMCLSLSRGVELLIHKTDLEEAIEKCMGLTIESRRLTEGKGRSELASGAKLVIKTLLQAVENKVTKSKLLQMHYGTFDVYELDRIIQTLEVADIIVQSHENGTVINMTTNAIINLKKWMER